MLYRARLALINATLDISACMLFRHLTTKMYLTTHVANVAKKLDGAVLAGPREAAIEGWNWLARKMHFHESI